MVSARLTRDCTQFGRHTVKVQTMFDDFILALPVLPMTVSNAQAWLVRVDTSHDIRSSCMELISRLPNREQPKRGVPEPMRKRTIERRRCFGT
jgi:hypothetical protein